MVSGKEQVVASNRPATKRAFECIANDLRGGGSQRYKYADNPQAVCASSRRATVRLGRTALWRCRRTGNPAKPRTPRPDTPRATSVPRAALWRIPMWRASRQVCATSYNGCIAPRSPHRTSTGQSILRVRSTSIVLQIDARAGAIVLAHRMQRAGSANRAAYSANTTSGIDARNELLKESCAGTTSALPASSVSGSGAGWIRKNQWK